MSTYCVPIRHVDWDAPEPGKSWREVEKSEGDVLSREAQLLLADALSSVRSIGITDQLEERFREQADKWERETRHLSSPTQMMMHPSYHAILGMGQEVVPLLVRDLQQNRRSWFWALSYLTHENPINPKDAGKMDAMIKAWVGWGKEKGLL